MSFALLQFSVAFVSALHATTSSPTYKDSSCSHKEADVVFALDSSGSIREEDFKKQLKFVHSLVDDFPIDQYGFHIGILTYGHRIHENFGLKEYFTGPEVTSAIDRIQYEGGGTNTGGAIKHAREKMFDFRVSGRKVNKIMFVITDGYSMNFENTTMEASISKSFGIKMVAVGVGHNVDENELHFIASVENERRLNFRVDDFSALETIKSGLLKAACVSDAPSTDTDGMIQDESYLNDSDVEHEAAKKYCGGKPADIYFIVDASSSITESQFYKMLQFIAYTVDILDIGGHKTRVGVVVYSDGIHPVITLTNNFDLPELKQRILRINHLKGGTETGIALEYLRTFGLAEDIVRKEVAHIGIILTDGQSSDTKQTAREAGLLKAMGVYLYVIGIGQEIDRDELKAIASDPESDFLYTLDSFDALASIKNILALKLCRENELKDIEEETMQDKECQPTENLDVMYVFDAFSIGIEKSKALLNVINDVMTSTNNPHVKSGVLTHSCTSLKPVPLSDNTYALELLEGLNPTQSDNLPMMLQELRTSAFKKENGDRVNAANAVVMFVDGNLASYLRLKMAVKRLTFGNKARLLVVGIGESPDTELNDLADIPMDGRFVHVTNYSDIGELVKTITTAICDQHVDIELPVY